MRARTTQMRSLCWWVASLPGPSIGARNKDVAQVNVMQQTGKEKDKGGVRRERYKGGQNKEKQEKKAVVKR